MSGQAASRASRSHFPAVAPFSYVLWRKSRSMALGDLACLTASYINRYSPIPEW